MTCKAIREGDEFSCAACGKRWPVEEFDRANCKGVAHSLTGRPAKVDKLAATIRLAQAAVGPHDDRWVGREKLLELRDVKWNRILKSHERKTHFKAAEALIAELRLMPREEVLALLDSKD